MSEEMPALRWAIDTAATPGRWGDLWGDTHFADSLARALRRLGQTVTVDRRDTRGRPDRRRDDVALTLRGIATDRPAPSPVNLLWVISHPDEVTAEEARSYDATFAASKKWALDKTAEWGLPVEPLLQCTDAQICDARHKGAAPAHPILFVGNARRSSSRPIVDWVGASAPAKLAIFGTGWEQTPHAASVQAASLANAALGGYYASAGIVLNDHWDDMRRAGFVSNRLFDAVASGARVLSDPIAGADELFGRSVVSCDSLNAVREVVSVDPDTVWPSHDERVRAGEMIRSEHSFDRRAQVLLTHASSLLGALSPDRRPALTNPARSVRPGHRWWRAAGTRPRR